MLQEMSRLQHAISLRCLVVTQRSLEPDLDAEWADKVVIADDKDIPRQLKYFLDHPKEREARIEKAYRHSKEHYNLKNWLQDSTFLGQYMRGGKGKWPPFTPDPPRQYFGRTPSPKSQGHAQERIGENSHMHL